MTSRVVEQFCEADVQLQHCKERGRIATKQDVARKAFYIQSLKTTLQARHGITFSFTHKNKAFFATPKYKKRVTAFTPEDVARCIADISITPGAGEEEEETLSAALADALCARFVTLEPAGYQVTTRVKTPDRAEPLPAEAMPIVACLVDALDSIREYQAKVKHDKKKWAANRKEKYEEAMKCISSAPVKMLSVNLTEGGDAGKFCVRMDTKEKGGRFGIRDLHKIASDTTKSWIEANSLSDDTASTNVRAIQSSEFREQLRRTVLTTIEDKNNSKLETPSLTCIKENPEI